MNALAWPSASNGLALCPPSLPNVAYPIDSGVGCAPAPGPGPSAVTRKPSRPPPPICTALPFQALGRFSCTVIGWACGSTGAICASTLQYAGLAFAPAPLAATRVALVTPAPEVGRPISRAETTAPDKAAHAAPGSAGAGAACAPAAPSKPHAITTDASWPVQRGERVMFM